MIVVYCNTVYWNYDEIDKINIIVIIN